VVEENPALTVAVAKRLGVWPLHPRISGPAYLHAPHSVRVERRERKCLPWES